ncbi:Tetratricopeptide repeat protein [uncultured archaeon]|nr:Tetratricopeptide repeat protein [uncultured archaeon]
MAPWSPGGRSTIIRIYDRLRSKSDSKGDINELTQECALLMDLGKYGKAARCYDEVLELEPENATASNNKGNSLMNLSKYLEAIH